jgi:hypothetical protein
MPFAKTLISFQKIEILAQCLSLNENTSSEQSQPVFFTGILLNSTNMIYLVKVKKKMVIYCSS